MKSARRSGGGDEGGGEQAPVFRRVEEKHS
jgi:hypothetical protein